MAPILPGRAQAPATETVVAADNVEEIAALIGKKAVIEGRVERVGKTEGGGITFLNFSRQRGGFVAVIFQPAYREFPDGFEKYQGRKVRVSGRVEVYKEAVAQIVVKKAEQLEIVED